MSVCAKGAGEACATCAGAAATAGVAVGAFDAEAAVRGVVVAVRATVLFAAVVSWCRNQYEYVYFA